MDYREHCQELSDECDRKDKEIARLRALNAAVADENINLRTALAAEVEKVRVCREALKFYADKRVWRTPSGPALPCPHGCEVGHGAAPSCADSDDGRRARKALSLLSPSGVEKEYDCMKHDDEPCGECPTCLKSKASGVEGRRGAKLLSCGKTPCEWAEICPAHRKEYEDEQAALRGEEGK